MKQEPEMHRRYSDFHAYEFFVARRPPSSTIVCGYADRVHDHE
jgi:hypothetical protein